MKTSILLLAILLVVSSFNLASKPNVPTHQQHKFNFVYPDLVKQLHTMKIPTDIDEQGLEALYHRYYQHYKDFLGPTPAKEVTYDWLMDEDNARISFELDYLFTLALERKLDVSRFSIFGLHTKPNGDIRYDFKKSKHLLQMSNLHHLLTNPEINEPWLVKLLQMGFTSKELTFIKAYGHTVSDRKISNTQVYLYYRYLNAISDSIRYTVKHKHTLSADTLQHQLSKHKFAHRYIRFQLWKQVGVNLFKHLTPRQQRILKVFLVEQNNASGSRGEPDHDEELARLISKVESGEWNKELELRLTTYEKQEKL